MKEKILPLVIVEIMHENGTSEYCQMCDVPESELDYLGKIFKIVHPANYEKKEFDDNSKSVLTELERYQDRLKTTRRTVN